jgi:elongator complex protein 5
MTAQVPGYSETSPDLAGSILNAVKQVPDGPLTVFIDSADVLCADLESPSKSYTLIATLLSGVIARPKPSRLILHFATHSSLRDLVLTPRLSPTLAHVIAHPPALLKHLATEQLLPPPPASTPDRFWPVFAPLSARTWEVERIVLGSGCVGLSDDGETVLQVVTRGRGKNVERDLDGWTLDGACSLSELDSLKGILEDKGKPQWAEVSKATPRVLRGMT